MTRSLFDLVVPLERTDRLFREVMSSPRFTAARRLADEIFAAFTDVDGSFVREFQTAGFSPRVFELALFAYLQEQGYDLDRRNPAPDFVIDGGRPVAIEVTTSNPPQISAETIADEPQLPWPHVPADLPAAGRAFVFQIGKALRRKLLHRDASGRAYWEMPHVVGKPFVIAVAAFHDAHAQFHPHGLVAQYLYGRRDIVDRDDSGRLALRAEPVASHELDGRTIPSGLFGLPEAENLAGVLFSNAHTISMLNRVGTERGYGPPDVALCRVGTAYDPDPEATEPRIFAYVVGDELPWGPERFNDGLHLFINPWARTKLPPTALSDIDFHELLHDGRVLSTSRNRLRPIVSKTLTVQHHDASDIARYQQLKFLGLIPPKS